MKLVVIAMLAACAGSAELTQPLLRARMGAAAERSVHRVVALPSWCGALSLVRVETANPDHPIWETRAECPASAMTAIDVAVRSSLEFGGFSIIDSEQVNAVTATRHEVVERGGFVARRTTEQQGARFEDATPFEQSAILKELGAEAVLTTRVWIGAGVGFSARRTVAVQVRLVATSDGALVWARRCELEVSGFTTDEIAMERGARCAIEGTRAQ